MGVNSLPKTVTRQRRDCDLYLLGLTVEYLLTTARLRFVSHFSQIKVTTMIMIWTPYLTRGSWADMSMTRKPDHLQFSRFCTDHTFVQLPKLLWFTFAFQWAGPSHKSALSAWGAPDPHLTRGFFFLLARAGLRFPSKRLAIGSANTHRPRYVGQLCQ